MQATTIDEEVSLLSSRNSITFDFSKHEPVLYMYVYVCVFNNKKSVIDVIGFLSLHFKN